MTTDETGGKLIAKWGNSMLDQNGFAAQYLAYYDVLKEFPEMGSIVNEVNFQPIKRIVCHKLLVPDLRKAFAILKERAHLSEIKTYGGCFMPRFIRGTTNVLSIHSFAFAIDWNTKHNPLGLDKQQAKNNGLVPFTTEFDQCWRDAGFTCGIDFKRKDGMHYQKYYL